MTARPVVGDAQRRARLMRRHLLADEVRADAVTAVADAMVGLHATTPSTVYLSARARMTDVAPEAISDALYRDRTLVKQLAMRRTLFVVTRPVLAEAIGAVGPRVAASERTNMLRDLRRSPAFDDPERWIDTARQAVLDDLADGAARTSTELRERLPALDGHVEVSPGKSWGGRVPMGPRVLNMMSAAGEIVRGPNTTPNWHQSRPAWASMTLWLGEPVPEVSVADGHRALVQRWLRSFGPGTEADLVWWLGTTKRAVRAALADLDVVEVALERGQTGYLMADDLDDDDDVEPRALLLPELDPTTMGWADRGFYLDPHAAHIFDRTGNGGQTAWWDGRIVGGWRQNREDGTIVVHPLEKLSRAASRALAAEAERLTAWLGDVRPTPGYPAPFMRR
ncbi:winged helix DNA-binding domain-containing protein [Gordonia sp. NPDC003424]